MYRYLRYLTRFMRSGRLKLLAAYALHITGRRYIGVYLDPILGCNLRCRMCYFSNEEKRSSMKGSMTTAEFTALGRIFYPRALKLQIGCGAEPTLYRDLELIVRQAHSYRVPYISLTTNGQLLDKEQIKTLVQAGLHEVTLSLHGTTLETYEWLMQGANFARFRSLLDSLAEVQREQPHFKVRINYTINKDNVSELVHLPELISPLSTAIVQLRPVQDIGQGGYLTCDPSLLSPYYETVILPVVDRLQAEGRTVIYPKPEHLTTLATDRVSHQDHLFEEMTYVYLSPHDHHWADLDLDRDSFRSASRRHHLARRMRRGIVGRAMREELRNVTRKGNYTVQ